MRVEDVFHLVDKKILIMDLSDNLPQASRDQMALAGATIVGPLVSVEHVLLAIPLHEPDALIIDVDMEATGIARIVSVLEEKSTPYVFASIGVDYIEFADEGFSLNGDADDLRKIIRALFVEQAPFSLH